ncbi:MAG TPA: hypothetical protein VK545_12540 [Streptomyces sp.]|nr:hypothetical protein [Streptomyces sp.]
MISRRHQETDLVRCEVCPGRPVLPTVGEINTGKCIRCQGRDRLLPVPHPEDHLCAVCRRECPDCGAPSPAGGRCLTCSGRCRTCRGPLPERPQESAVRKESRSRKDHKKTAQWERIYLPRHWWAQQCDACRRAASSPDPVRAVLAALPDKVIRACGGTAPPAVVDTIRAELRHHSAAQLTARIERRWWGGWTHRPLHREPDEHQDGYRPDDVARWLLAPPPCPARCDDGWMPGDPDTPCPTCRTQRPQPSVAVGSDDEQAPAATPADRTPAEAIAHRPLRECDGRDGTCGRPVAAPYTTCPSCLDWPRCACGRRHDPDRATTCDACSTEG